MFTRATGMLIVPFWLAAMGWLVAHDVIPAWTATDPPLVRPNDWLAGEGKNVQFSIHVGGQRTGSAGDSTGSQVGTLWTKYLSAENSLQRRDVIWIEQFPLPIAPLRATTTLVFTGDGLLDEFTVLLENRMVHRIRLHGERFPTDFSFTLEHGALERAFKIPLTDGGIIGSAFNPFAQLTDLKVGDAWRMQVFNPIAAVTGVGDRFLSILVKVTGRETLDLRGEVYHCFVVESPDTKAWVDSRGVVWVQEFTLPVGGTMRIVRETGFDGQTLADVRNARL